MGEITADEFECGFRRHGKISLRPINARSVRVEVYNAVMNIPIVAAGTATGRYQQLKMSIGPLVRSSCPVPIDIELQPMPVMV